MDKMSSRKKTEVKYYHAINTKDSTVTSGAKLSMIGETGWLRKTNKQRTYLLSSR